MHTKKQKPFAALIAENIPYINLDAKEIILPYSTPFNFNIHDIAKNYSGVAYAKNQDGLLFPVKEIKPGDICSEVTISKPVSVNGNKYYDSYKCQSSAKEEKIIIGDNIAIILNTEEKIMQYKIVSSGPLSSCIKNLRFLIDALQNKEFCLGDTKVPLDVLESKVEEYTSGLNLLVSLQSALSKCHLTKELILNPNTLYDNKHYLILIDTIEKGREIKLDISEDAVICNLMICGQKIVCLAQKTKDNYYKISAFDPTKEAEAEREETRVKISAYTILRSDNLDHVLNIDFSKILDDIKKFETSETCLGWANNFALQLLLAYDNSKEKILLKTAEDIFDWISEQPSSENIRSELNLLQCNARKKEEFSEKELDFLHNIIESNFEKIFKFGAYVLLKDRYAANRCFEKLENKDQEGIKELPIYNLWQSMAY